jgi:uncharacterized membrane protein YgcG
MSTAAIVGVALATILVITVALVWVRRPRDETPEERRRRARRDHDKSRKWLHGSTGGMGDGHGGYAGGGGCSGGGDSGGGGGCGGGGGD